MRFNFFWLCSLRCLLLTLQMPKASLELATGQRFEGFSFGAKGPAAGEVKWKTVPARLFLVFKRGCG
jgi:hypothetical protein